MHCLFILDRAFLPFLFEQHKLFTESKKLKYLLRLLSCSVYPVVFQVSVLVETEEEEVEDEEDSEEDLVIGEDEADSVIVEDEEEEVRAMKGSRWMTCTDCPDASSSV